jgi:hypothetical protein
LVGALLYIIWNGQVICPWCWVLLEALCCCNGLAKCRIQHNAQGRDHSVTLRYGSVGSTIIKNSYSIEILITITSLWSSPEDYVIECGQENDIICHPKSLM